MKNLYFTLLLASFALCSDNRKSNDNQKKGDFQAPSCNNNNASNNTNTPPTVRQQVAVRHRPMNEVDTIRYTFGGDFTYKKGNPSL